MEKQFVNYKIALKLKELGFNKPCFAYKLKKESPISFVLMAGKDVNYLYNSKVDIGTAVTLPLYSQVIDWFREKYRMNIVIQNTYYCNRSKVAYIFFIEGDDPKKIIYDYQDLYDEILDASEQDNPGDHINEELYDKNIFEMRFAYKTYEKCREKAILKCIELCKQ